MVGAHKLPADEQGVGNAPGHRLLRIGDLQPVLAAVTQQGTEGVRLPGGTMTIISEIPACIKMAMG